MRLRDHVGQVIERSLVRLAHRAGELGAGDAVAEPELDVGAAGADLAQPPAAALVQAGDARPRHVARLVELDDLDETADLGRPDAHQHPVARPAAALLVAADLPAGDTAEEVQLPGRVGDPVPDDLALRRDVDLRGDPHPTTGRRRSAASASRVSCITRMTWW